MSEDSKILVITDQTAVKEQLKTVLGNYINVHHTHPEEVKKEIDRISPDVVLLYHPKNHSSVDLVQYIQSEISQVKIVFITDHENFELLRDVIRAGALEFFVIPNEITLLGERLGNIINLSKQQDNTEEIAAKNQNFKRGRGQVYSFYSGKGGSGRTFLASAFAQTLKLESTAKVILVDLNLQYGGVETYLGIESNRSLVELAPVINEINESHIHNVIETEKHSNLELLLSPRDTESAENITDDFVSKLIRSCRRNYDFVIIDLPSSVNEVTYTALEESDLIYYILNLDTPSFQVFKYVEVLFQRLSIDTTQRMEIIINQASKDTELKITDLKNFIEYPITTQIRRDFKGIQALANQGLPLRKGQKEKKMIPIARDIRKWVLDKI